MRKVEIEKTINIPLAQCTKAMFYCVNCNGVGGKETHYSNCSKPEVYAIPSTVKVPRKRASKRTWELFKQKVVYSRPVGYWAYITKSWWYTHKKDELHSM